VFVYRRVIRADTCPRSVPSTPLRENLLPPEILRRSTLRTALRQQEAAGEQLSFQPGAWIELATVEDETSSFPEAERLTLERLEWLAESLSSCPECPPIRSNIGSPDPSIGAHEARSLPPLGFIEAAKVAGPVLWGKVVQRVVDGVGLVADAIEKHGRLRRSLGFLAGNDPEAPHGWSIDHLALLGAETSGQRMLGLPDLDPALLRARTPAVCTRSLEALDEPEPDEPAEGGPAAEEEWTMTPEEIAALAAAIGDAVAAKIEPMMAARTETPAEPTAEERAATEAATAAAATERSAWTAEVTDRLDRCTLDRRLSVRDRPALVTSISAMGREKGEPEVRAIEARTTLAPVEPLQTAALSERNRNVLAHLPAGVRIDDTNVDRTLSYVAHRERMGLKPGQPLTREQAQELLAIRAREQAAV
jgi:hypothetical protein